MSAKFVHSFSEENSEFQKQAGCMTGIFQIFDRNRLLGGRRFNGHHQKRITSEKSLENATNAGTNAVACPPQLVLEKNLSKNLSENQRMSMESSRTSFSSSSCSSFSSVDCNKLTLQGPASLSQVSFQDKSPRLKTLEIDFRDVIKDSMNKEPQSLCKEDCKQSVLGYKDSPRPMQLSKSLDGSYVIGIDGQSRPALDLNESFRVLMKLKEAPWAFSEIKETSRSSFEAKEVHLNRRFSYDGTRESGKHASKLRELPRLSLDSREGSIRNSNSVTKDLDRSSSNKERSLTSLNAQRELGSQKCAPGVVAKLMGLEAMPTLCSNHEGLAYAISQKDPNKNCIKNPAAMSKPYFSVKSPIEPAPWKQKEKLNVLPHSTLKQQSESVYSEIEKRLKELEFHHANKDLRALKQILDAMQAKGLLESRRNEPEHSPKSVKIKSDQNLGTVFARKPPLPSSTKGINAARADESPIVLMKPARSLNKFDGSTKSVIRLQGLNSLQRLRTSETTDKKKEPGSSKLARDWSPRGSPRSIGKTEDNCQKSRIRTELGSSRPQQSSRDNNSGSEKTSNSVSPRLQQRKLEAERRMRSSLVASSDSNYKRLNLSTNKQPSESISPRNKIQHRPTLSPQGDDMSQRSDSNVSSPSQLDMEDATANTKIYSSEQVDQTSILLKQKSPPVGLDEEASILALAAVAAEQPSPISVLDAATFYQDDYPAALMKRSTDISKGIKPLNPDNLCESRNITSEINHKKLESIGNLLQKLEQLHPTAKKPSTADHIASLCETQNPDHRYISEILLASGLLMKDLLPIQLHPSGHPINPDLFLVLEQTKASHVFKREGGFDVEKMHRKLVFDVVNELLSQKLELTSSFCQARKLQGRLPSGQLLLKDLCFGIERLEAEALKAVGPDDDNHRIGEEALRQLFEWDDCRREIPAVVLDIERSIFKDMIDEVVCGEASSLKFKHGRRRRQLFAK